MPRIRFSMRAAMLCVLVIGVGVWCALRAPAWMAEYRHHRAIAAALDEPIEMPFEHDTPFEDVVKYVRTATQAPDLPEGLPIFVEANIPGYAIDLRGSTIHLASRGVPLRKSLDVIARQLGPDLAVTVSDGLVLIHRRGPGGPGR
jgi:hypothetical protein